MKDPLASVRSLQDLIVQLSDVTGFDLVGFQLSPNPEVGGREMLLLTFEVPPILSDEDPIRGMVEAMIQQLNAFTTQHDKESE